MLLSKDQIRSYTYTVVCLSAVVTKLSEFTFPLLLLLPDQTYTLSPLNIFVALAKILVSYALGNGGGAAISDNGSRITRPTHPI